jgi:hypothetical protein
MKIKGQNPNAVFPRTQGHMVQVFDPRGTWWRKWPRRRPGPLPAITEAQAALFDLANSIVKFAEPSEFTWATAQSLGTAFYARDILISAMYGNYVSWPGLGVTVGGLSSEDKIGPARNPLVSPRLPSAPGTTVNSIRSYDQETGGPGGMTIKVTTNLPASAPILFMSCEPYSMIPKKTVFGGEYVPHGYTQFAKSLCGMFDATSGGVTQWEWDIVPCCQPPQPCFYWIGELETPTASNVSTIDDIMTFPRLGRIKLAKNISIAAGDSTNSLPPGTTILDVQSATKATAGIVRLKLSAAASPGNITNGSATMGEQLSWSGLIRPCPNQEGFANIFWSFVQFIPIPSGPQDLGPAYSADSGAPYGTIGNQITLPAGSEILLSIAGGFDYGSVFNGTIELVVSDLLNPGYFWSTGAQPCNSGTTTVFNFQQSGIIIGPGPGQLQLTATMVGTGTYVQLSGLIMTASAFP